MTTTTHPSRLLGHNVFTASVAHDGASITRPLPGMSPRAAIFARALGALVLTVATAAIDARLLVLLAFAFPFWIAAEFETRRVRQRRSVPGPNRMSSLRPSKF
jgi:hypothetical protein